jgi:hypothetical protein
MVGRGKSDEGEWEVTFQSIWNADDAAFGDVGVRGDGLLD